METHKQTYFVLMILGVASASVNLLCVSKFVRVCARPEYYILYLYKSTYSNTINILIELT